MLWLADLLESQPPTGEPSARNWPARFGGRGDLIRRPYPYLRNGRPVLLHGMIPRVVAVQIGFCCVDCLIDRGARFGANTADSAIVAIPGTPYSPALGLFDVDRITDAFFCVIQFLNFDACHHTYLLRLHPEVPPKPRTCPGTDPDRRSALGESCADGRQRSDRKRGGRREMLVISAANGYSRSAASACDESLALLAAIGFRVLVSAH